MDIDWMNREEMAEAIPPYYTEWIGGQLMSHLRLTELEQIIAEDAELNALMGER